MTAPLDADHDLALAEMDTDHDLVLAAWERMVLDPRYLSPIGEPEPTDHIDNNRRTP